MSATIAEARACARTLLFDSLRIHAFKGAIPHVMLVVDGIPCVQQKVLVEGYRQELEAFNGRGMNHNLQRTSAGDFFIPLTKGAATPCGSSGIADPNTRISYSVLPFRPQSFAEDMVHLQAFFRQCGSPTLPDGVIERSFERFKQSFAEVTPYLQPLSPVDGTTAPVAEELWSGPSRELLGFILIQRNAFQNDLKQYRLRLQLFDMGTRVAEHCHLECMSVAADALAAAGKFEAALQDDQVLSYARSCSFSPHVAECIARGLADSIDLFSWERKDLPSAPSAVPPPPSLMACLHSDALSSLFRRGAFQWEGQPASMTDSEYKAAMAAPILGAGQPLRIVSTDPDHTLTFSGGMEDCLMNTGYYRAAADPMRNDAAAHRQRFPCQDSASRGKPAAEELAAADAAEAVHGRMKKKEYLAMLKQRGQKPNKRFHDSDDDEVAANSGRHPAGSSISSSIGGTFPIGEVISESFDLSQLNGSCQVFAYPDSFKQVAMATPASFVLTIEKGIVTHVSDNAPANFVDLLSLVRQTEGNCYVRELGIGLNPFTGPAHVLSDVTSFERQWGVHLSLGQRHPLFVKQKSKHNADGSVAETVAIEGPVLKRKAGKFHIDVFVDAAQLQMGALTIDFARGVAVA